MLMRDGRSWIPSHRLHTRPGNAVPGPGPSRPTCPSRRAYKNRTSSVSSVFGSRTSRSFPAFC